jgi:hypothetical protein
VAQVVECRKFLGLIISTTHTKKKCGLKIPLAVVWIMDWITQKQEKEWGKYESTNLD